MKINLNIISFICLILAILISLFLWDLIKLPYDNTNLIQGTAFNKKINPYDNTLKVLFFLFFPIISYLIIFLKKKKIYSINPFNKNFFLNQKINISEKSYQGTFNEIQNYINFILLIILFFCVIEFFSLDFNILLRPVDVYHDGLLLLPPINYFNYGSFWSSIHFDYGIGGNLRSLVIWKFLNDETIGSARFFDQGIILLIKILIIFICRKITQILHKENFSSIIFFLLLSFSSIQLTDYFVSLTGTAGSEFPLRLSLFLLFYLILIDNIYSDTSLFKGALLGLFSSISFLWYTDIAFYINGILVFYIVFLLLTKSFKNIFFILVGVFFSWIIFILIFGSNEVNLMFYQIKSNLDFIYYFNFLEFPKPFSDHYSSSRALKSLILIIINAIICINLCFKKKYEINSKGKLLIIITFICSLIIFKSALIRSDAYHLKYTLGFIFLCLFVQIYYLLIVEQNKISLFFKNLNFIKNKKISIMIIFILTIIFFQNKINFNKINANFSKNIKDVLTKKDDYFLNFKPGMYSYGRVYTEKNINDDREFIFFYKKLTEKDSCIQNFTEYLVLGYFLKKPSCTSFYNPQFIQHNNTDKKFIKEFSQNLPEYILFKSPVIFFDKSGYQQQKSLLDGVPNVENFINKNYTFFTTYLNNWVIYKRKY